MEDNTHQTDAMDRAIEELRQRYELAIKNGKKNDLVSWCCQYLVILLKKLEIKADVLHTCTSFF